MGGIRTLANSTKWNDVENFAGGTFLLFPSGIGKPYSHGLLISLYFVSGSHACVND